MNLKKWNFSPDAPATVPERIAPVLTKKGVPESEIRLIFRTDMNRELIRCDNYLIVTQSEIILLSGTSDVIGKETKSFFPGKRTESVFEELSWDVYPLDTVESTAVEELLTTARIVAKCKDGSYELLANLSNTYKNDAFTGVRCLNELIKDGEIHPPKEERKKGDHSELFCPKCGNRYINPEKKICAKCQDKGKVVKRTGVFLLKYKFKVAAVIGTMLLTSALAVIAPYVSSGFYYDQVLEKTGKFYGEILLVLCIILGTRLLNLFVGIINSIVSSRVAANLSYDLKKTIFNSIERLSLSFFTNKQTGGLMTQVNRDANTIYWFFCDGIPYFLINALQIFIIIIIMMKMNWLLTLVSLITVPIVCFCIKKLFSHMRALHNRRYTRSSKMNSVLSDVLSGMRVVKAFSKEQEEVERFNHASKATAAAQKQSSYFSSLAFPALNLLFYISHMVILGAGGWFVIQGNMTYGILMTFIAYMEMIYDPLFRFVDMTYQAVDSLNAMSRLIEVMDAKSDVEESENPVTLETVEGHVEFRDVKFGYEKNRTVIDGVSFDIEPGRCIGIVGHTGAGKSTLVNLLIRLYDVSEGGIYIDGVNVRDLSFRSIRENVSIVSQETYLFMGTILENIKYARPDATDEEVIEAAKIAGAHDFIIKLPDAYETMIGFGYKDLSGGERQRVSIARAILRNPKILILDEATAAMDTETERKIQNALEKLVVGRTTIMIAHRLSTLRDADKLIVIENGKMPEFGTHAELIAQKGIYYKLYTLQLDAMKNIGVE